MTSVIPSDYFHLDGFIALIDRNNANSAVPPQIPTEQIEGAASINYSDFYKNVMNRFRGLISIKERSPRFCVASSMAIFANAANYDAWKWRRDVLFENNGDTFIKCCIAVDENEKNNAELKEFFEQSGSIPYVTDLKRSWKHLSTSIREKTDALEQLQNEKVEANNNNHFDENSNNNRKQTLENELGELMKLAWAPNSLCLFLPSEIHSHSPPRYLYCCCRAAAWELANSRTLAMSFAKGFQAWNHRRDVIEQVAGVDDDDDDDENAEETRKVSWKNCNCRGECALPFNAFDERAVTTSALINSPKNYHVWIHRSWFLSFFGMLFNDKVREDELEFTNKLLEQDVFNNSAWAHRGLIFKYCLAIPGFQKYLKNLKNGNNTSGNSGKKISLRYFPQWLATSGKLQNPVPADQRDVQDLVSNSMIVKCGRTSDNENVTEEEEEKKTASMILQLVLGEISWALQLAVSEPRNEAPFTYVSGLISLVFNAFERHKFTSKKSLDKSKNEETNEANLRNFLKQSLDLLQQFSLEPFYNLNDRVAKKLGAKKLPSVRPPRLEPEIPSSLKSELRSGNTKQEELTHPSLWKDNITFQILGFLASLNVAKNENDENNASSSYFDEAIILGNKLAQNDPWRRKYWLQEVAMLTMTNNNSK